MLIEFRVENHRSLRDEQALTFEAGRGGDIDDPRPREVGGNAEKLLPAIVIYGANASGKSNVLAALVFMREAVVFSQRGWDPLGGVPRSSFAWGGNQVRSSTFEVEVLVDQVKYRYGFTVNDQEVEEEWLHAWPNNHKQIWFERDGETFKFGEHLRGPNDAVQEVTRTNSLFLSAAPQHKHEKLVPLYAWFRSIVPVNVTRSRFRGLNRMSHEFFFWPDDSQGMLFAKEESELTLASRISQLLRSADLGIVDVKRTETEVEINGRKNRQVQVLLQHQAEDEDSWLRLDEESEGTKTLFRLAPLVFRALDSGGCLVVDELESSLHPLLGLAILKMFNCPKSNPQNAQLLFTTHDTNLLGTTLGDPPLRRDQIWFTEKDSEGISRLYPLTDFKPRKAENLERGYLQGRYGAIPFLGEIEWITELD